MVEVLAIAIFITTTLWRFKVPASKQSVAFCSQTTLSWPACLKESEFAQAGQPRKPASFNSTAFFPAMAENRKTCVQLFTNTMCFVAGPLKSSRVLQLKLSQEASLR